MVHGFIKLRGNAGQGMLETSLAIFIAILLLGGIIRIWLWGNEQIVKRQQAYEASRVKAGTAEDDATLQWPVYTPAELTENMVLLNTSSGS